MKLNQIMTQQTALNAINSVWQAKPEIVKVLDWTFLNLIIKNGERVLRPSFQNEQQIINYLTGFFTINRKKIEYLVSTAENDFLILETTSTNEMENTNFNTDFMGGEGQTGKGKNQILANTKSIDHREKLINQFDLIDNELWIDLFNKLCEIWTVGWLW